MSDGVPHSASALLGTASRRALIARAARRLVPVASGLFVAISLEEALGREGSFGGQLGGRHGKNRRGRDKQQRRKRKRANQGNNNSGGNKGPGLGAIDDLSASLIIENLTAAPIDFQGWAKNTNRRLNVNCVLKDLQTIAPNTAPTFNPDSYGAIALLFGSIYIAGYDRDPDRGFPFVDVFHNVLTMDRVYCEHGPNISNPVVIDVENRQLGVGQSFDITVEGHNLTIRREGDTNGARTFRIQVKS